MSTDVRCTSSLCLTHWPKTSGFNEKEYQLWRRKIQQILKKCKGSPALVWQNWRAASPANGEPRPPSIWDKWFVSIQTPRLPIAMSSTDFCTWFLQILLHLGSWLLQSSTVDVDDCYDRTIQVHWRIYSLFTQIMTVATVWPSKRHSTMHVAFDRERKYQTKLTITVDSYQSWHLHTPAYYEDWRLQFET